MSTHGPSPGKALITMDLPRAVHALLFDRHAGMAVRKEADGGVRIVLSEPGGSVEILIDDETLDALLGMIAEARGR
ncbi:hypothetical protein ACM64Y_17315 [Novispirillum sp. DQ9]|uniref:hypothetical protein n=1 Tax=Novispirillum sp. DQ9 TaxID=3398612 RepID=UPI003C7DC485